MKTLRVTLADIIGPTGTPNSTATVHARYVDTSGRGRDVHLTDGTIVVPVRRSVTPGTGPEEFDFEVIPSDDGDVREADRGFLAEVSWTVTAPEGGKSHGVRRVLITADMGATVHLGLLAQPEPVPPYTGGYALAPDLAAEVATRAAADAALDGRVDALEVAPPAHTHPLADVTDAGTAAAADVGDFATAAQGALADSATQPGDLATVATTGAYADLSGKPTLGTAAATASTDYATAAQGTTADGAAQKSANLSDLASASTARTNLGLTDSAVVGALPIPDPGSFYPTDTITAALQLIGGRHIYGTGSPEGGIIAPVGTYYTDTAGTTGAWRWLKKTGTGNTGWKVVHGDTGWRNITTFLNGWTGRLQLRRINDDLHYRTDYSGANSLVGTAATAGVFVNLSVASTPGMYPLGERRVITYRPTGALLQTDYYYHTGWELPAFGTASDAYTFPAGSFFIMDTAWPTTLPGTAG